MARDRRSPESGRDSSLAKDERSPRSGRDLVRVGPVRVPHGFPGTVENRAVPFDFAQGRL